MSGNERDSKSGPFGTLPNVLGGFDVAMKGFEPALQNTSRWNLELIGFMTKRTRAWLGLPGQLSQCKSPIEFAGEQMRFWQTAASDYAEASKRLVAAACATGTLPALNGTPPRDYIAFPDAPPEAAPAPKRSDRKAA
jgi:hypothetical protein